MKTFRKKIECPSCFGTGARRTCSCSAGAAVVCEKCKGSGAYDHVFKYTEFNGKRRDAEIERVYADDGFPKELGIVEYEGIGEIDMDQEGVSYADFLDGKMPGHIRALACPMKADQGACESIPGFTDACRAHDIRLGARISECQNQCRKSECWVRFYAAPRHRQ